MRDKINILQKPDVSYFRYFNMIFLKHDAWIINFVVILQEIVTAKNYLNC